VGERQVISTDRAPKPSGYYSQAIKVGNLIFTAQLGPHNPETGRIESPNDMRAQTFQCLKNMQALLEAAGSSLEQIVQVTAYIVDAKWAEFDAAYGEFFKDIIPPARCIVGIEDKGAKQISLSMIATCKP
jgi:2-iminobutanoate/2-iminopropanoate deaminase